MIAFGLPSDPRTFSGYAKSLHDTLRENDLLKHEYSSKSLRITDALSGAFRVGWQPRGKLSKTVKRSWFWSERGYASLEKRLLRQIRTANDKGPFLEVGTYIALPASVGPQYVLTDMTIPQAVKSGHFEISQLTATELQIAESIQHRSLHNAQHIFTLSEWAKQSCIEDFGVATDKITVVYAGTNLPVRPNAKPRKPGNILFVGIDWERKGGPMLLKAFKKLREKRPDATLTIVGCCPEVAIDGVEVLGYLDRRIPARLELLYEVYERAELFCLLSEFDPFPNVIIEAASQGLPTIALDRGSRPEAIVHGETGILVAEPSPELLAKEMETMLNGHTARDMGVKAKEKAQRDFTWTAVVEKITNIINSK